MNIIPCTNHLLVRMHDVPTGDGKIIRPDSSDPITPYGEVIAAGPDCKFVEAGELVFFRPDNMTAGFDPHGDPRFIVPEPAVFAKLILLE